MRVLLCDDHRLFVEPIATALTRRGHEVLVRTSPDDALRAVGEFRPDVCLIDLQFPDGDGVETVARLRQEHPSCLVVVLSGSADPRDQEAVAAAGAAGFLRKAQPISAIFEALDGIAAGRRLPPPIPVGSPAGSAERARVHRLVDLLTTREREVLRRLVEAQDTVTIARALGMAPSTTRTHMQNVLHKLGVHTRLQAVALVVGAGVDDEL
ncbi:response regulator [Geodermatophilus sp. SYSU D01176]